MMDLRCLRLKEQEEKGTLYSSSPRYSRKTSYLILLADFWLRTRTELPRQRFFLPFYGLMLILVVPGRKQEWYLVSCFVYPLTPVYSNNIVLQLFETPWCFITAKELKAREVCYGRHSLTLCSIFDLGSDGAIMKTPPKVRTQSFVLFPFYAYSRRRKSRSFASGRLSLLTIWRYLSATCYPRARVPQG